MYKKLKVFILLTVICSIKTFAADTVTVQTFTFDSIMTRQAKFKFPTSDEKFNRIICKYRLKCDELTQHDTFACGEWDYLAYLRKLKPTGNYLFSTKTQPEYEFYNVKLQDGNSKATLTDNIVFDKYKTKLTKTNVQSNNISTHKVTTGTSNIGSFSNHQFVILYNDLTNAGIDTSSKIGQITVDANITDTIRNFIIRIAKINTSTLQTYNYTATFDTVCIQSIVAPSDCIDSKLTLNFLKDYKLGKKTNLLVEFIGEMKSNSKNQFIGNVITEKRGITGLPSICAKLAGTNPMLDVAPLPTISGHQHFTFESWVKMDNGLQTGSGFTLFSIGDRVRIYYSEIDNDSARITISITDANDNPNTAVVCNSTSYSNNDRVPIAVGKVAKYNQWNHIAVVYDGENSTTFPEMLKVYVNGVQKTVFFLRWYDENGGEWNVHMPRFIDNEPSTFTIGRGVFAGCFDNIRVWDTSLSDATIKNWYQKDIDNTHPNYANLVNNFEFNEDYASHTATNTGNSGNSAKVIGDVSFVETSRLFNQTNFIPNITLSTGDFTYTPSAQTAEFEKQQIAASIVYYDTTSPKPYYPMISKVEYKYGNYSYTYDETGKAIDSTVNTGTKEYETDTVKIAKFTYTTKPYEIKQVFELGRFITPYGINLDLGPNGFEWEYDLTDYMHELRDSVEILAHNNMELIDLKFLFIKGEPNRDILRIVEPWGPASSNNYVKYANNEVFSDTVITLLPNTKTVKAKVRITGHGGDQNNNNCCEFMYNTHQIYSKNDVNSPIKAAEWKIEENCYNNPVYPQGGTWPTPREGWCPGAAVKDYEFDLTQYIVDGKIALNYEINPSAPMGSSVNGNYYVNFHLIEYADAIYQNDLELFGIINPSNADIYSRINPICNGINVIVRNNTNSDISNFDLKCENGANVETISFSKVIKARSMDTINVMLSDPAFWIIDNNEPTIKVTVINKQTADDNSSNDIAQATFKVPDIYQKDNFKIVYKTNSRANQYSLKIYNFANEVVKTLSAPNNNKLYDFYLTDLPNGCYRMELVDEKYYFGLSYWAFPSPPYPAQGSGSIGIYNNADKALKQFNPDFGKTLVYPFVLNNFSSISSHDIINSIYVFPNPTTDNIIINASEHFGNATIRIYDLSGKTVLEKQTVINANEQIEINVSNLNTGSYSICVSIGDKSQWSKFVKQ